ncbi:MAG: S1C family serine protease [Phycisphaerales bacterium]
MTRPFGLDRRSSLTLMIVALIGALLPSTPVMALGDVDEDVVERAEALSAAFRAVSESVSPGVVRIEGYNPRGMITGSGFVIRPDGHIVTNSHVVESAASLIVESADGARRPAELIGADPLTDLAVIKIDGGDLPVLALSSEDKLQVGDWVIAVGFPLGLEQTVTAGIVSAVNRRLNIVGSSVGRRGYEAFIQTDAAINRGNSGGPLLNLRGDVVGVNSVIVTRTGGSDGLGFAIPASLVRFITEALIREGRVVRGFLGVDLQDLTPTLAESYGLAPSQHGVLLTRVSPAQPAGQAGLQPEDILIQIDDEPVHDVEALRDLIAMRRPGDAVAVTVVRNGEPREFRVTLAEMQVDSVQLHARIDPDAGGRFGFSLYDLSARANRDLGKPGVVVHGVVPGKAAHLAGFEEDDIIVEVDSGPLATIVTGPRSRSASTWLERLVDETPSDEIIRFTVLRNMAESGSPVYTPRYLAISAP